MEASAGLVAGSHNRNELVVIRRDGEPGKARTDLSSAEASRMENYEMDDGEELFDRYDPEVLAANGIDYQELSRFPMFDERMDIKWWAFLMQVEGRLTPASMSTPPLRVIRYPDLMEKGWGWWRLLPIYRNMDSDMPLYRQYLCEYYLRNPAESVDGATFTEHKVVVRSAWTNENGRLIPLANKCLEMEAKFLDLCETNMTKLTDKETALSRDIKGRVHAIINGACKYAGAYAAAAALVCISKEAELMCEWVMRQQYKSSYRNCMECNQIREHALSFMLYKGSGSIAAAAGAAMVGAAREAKLVLQFLRHEQTIDKSMCDSIREEACCILQDMCTEAFGANGNNIVAADEVEKFTSINTVGNVTCTEAFGANENNIVAGDGVEKFTSINTFGNVTCTEAFGAKENNIVAGDAVEKFKSGITTVANLTCTASNDKEDHKRKVASERRNDNKENMDVNQMTEEEASKETA